MEVRVLPGPPRSLSNRKISLRLAKGPQLAGFDVRRFGLRGDFFPPGADFGPSVSARGNPVSRQDHHRQRGARISPRPGAQGGALASDLAPTRRASPSACRHGRGCQFGRRGARSCNKEARCLLRRDATQRPTFARPRSCQLAAARTATMADLVRSGRGGVPLLVAIYLGLR